MTPKCSIVIRAYNEEKGIGRLLDGISQQVFEGYEIILVDSGSTDKTVEIAKGHEARIVTIKPEEFTFGRSLNRGIEAAQGEFIVITSAHCYPVYPDWLEQLLAPFSDPQVAISYGKQRSDKSNHYSEQQWFRRYFPEVSIPRQGHPYCHNANAAIRRELWLEHRYNENLTGLEDLAWGSWAFGQGHVIAYQAEAEITHPHEESFKQVYNRYRREAIAMKQILPQSHFNLWNFFRLTVDKVAADSTQAYRDRVLGKQFFDILLFRLHQYWATYQGYRYSGKIDAQLHQQFYYPPGILSDKKPAARQVEPIKYSD
jgi:glycosyltransferase involved in cell wall biosynthesis